MASASPRSADAPDDLTMVEGASLPPLAPGADRAGTAGVLLGRYVIIEHAGSGAMGSVLRAYDPRLHREVAIKRVHASRRDPAAQRRLLREAQAMAQLSHPHTVAVYDVEPSDEGIYFAMEYVPGGTLEQWLAKRPRTLPEILAVMRQAGEGLAAAHAADLVHRDFKPTNVLVTEDGRAKVTDFGLAKPAASHDSSSSCPSPAADDQLTLAGTVMGTPRYMAPEQHMGADADARADQYAWCVTLWGSRPSEPNPAKLHAFSCKRLGSRGFSGTRDASRVPWCLGSFAVLVETVWRRAERAWRRPADGGERQHGAGYW